VDSRVSVARVFPASEPGAPADLAPAVPGPSAGRTSPGCAGQFQGHYEALEKLHPTVLRVVARPGGGTQRESASRRFVRNAEEQSKRRWRRWWDSNPISFFTFCRLQSPHCEIAVNAGDAVAPSRHFTLAERLRPPSLGRVDAAGDAPNLRFGVPRGGPRLAQHLWRMCFALFTPAGSAGLL
jgi:hypothetical protein